MDLAKLTCANKIGNGESSNTLSEQMVKNDEVLIMCACEETSETGATSLQIAKCLLRFGHPLPIRIIDCYRYQSTTKALP